MIHHKTTQPEVSTLYLEEFDELEGNMKKVKPEVKLGNVLKFAPISSLPLSLYVKINNFLGAKLSIPETMEFVKDTETLKYKFVGGKIYVNPN